MSWEIFENIFDWEIVEPETGGGSHPPEGGAKPATASEARPAGSEGVPKVPHGKHYAEAEGNIEITGEEAVVVMEADRCAGAYQAIIQLVQKVAADTNINIPENCGDDPFWKAVVAARQGDSETMMREARVFTQELKLWRPGETLADAQLFPGTKFILTDSGEVVVIAPDGKTQLAWADCADEKINVYDGEWIDSKPCEGPLCEVAEATATRELVVVIPPESTGPQITRVQMLCDGELQYVDILRFKDMTVEEVEAYLQGIAKTNPNFFAGVDTTNPQKFKPFIVIGNERYCLEYKLVGKDEVQVTVGKSLGPIEFGEDPSSKERVEVPSEDADAAWAGDKSFKEVAAGVENPDEESSDFTQEPISPISLDANGKITPQAINESIDRTMYREWFEEMLPPGVSTRGMTPEEIQNNPVIMRIEAEYARMLRDITLPERFYRPDLSMSERAAIIMEKAAALQPPVIMEPGAALKLAEVITDEAQQGMSTEGTLGAVVERAATAKVMRVAEDIAATPPSLGKVNQ